MSKKWIMSGERLTALGGCLFCVLAFMLVVKAADAGEGIPVPAKKPAYKVSESGKAEEDLSKDLLDFGKPPIPKPTPFAADEGPIASDQAGIYKKIFSFQAAGKMKAADKEIAKLTDMRLRGHVLYQRYMHPSAYKSEFEELQNWLILYSDQPGAEKIEALASRKGSGSIKKASVSKQIQNRGDPTIRNGRTYVSSKKRSAAENEKIKKLRQSVISNIHKTRPTQALKILEKSETAKLMDSVEYDILRGRIAAGYLYSGNVKKAYELASASAGRSGLNVPLAGWIAGLSSWLKGDYDEAASFFEIPARSSYASNWTSAAGAYWAARSHMRTGNVRAVSDWLKRSMENPRSFYGLVSTRALGRDFQFNWAVPEFTEEDKKIIEQSPAGRRAMALVAAGQTNLAEAELTRVSLKDPKVHDALFAYAVHMGLPSLAMNLVSHRTGPEDGMYYDAALYPTGNWAPKDGYKIDSALIHAIMRQESRFDPEAESPRGAKGLMQLMPATASYVAGSSRLKSKEGQHKLLEPETNLEIGQKYLSTLMQESYVQGDILSLLVAYNAGPGNLARWKRQWKNIDDDLLFIELIPSRETRNYVEHVLSNYWMYRLRGGLETPTLDALAAGEPARYAENNNKRKPQKFSRNNKGKGDYKVAYND